MSFFSFSTAHTRGMVKHSLKGAAHFGQELVGALSSVFSSELSTTSSGISVESFQRDTSTIHFCTGTTTSTKDIDGIVL